MRRVTLTGFHAGRTLDNELGAQETVGPVTLDRLAGCRIRWNEIKEAVDRLVDYAPRPVVLS